MNDDASPGTVNELDVDLIRGIQAILVEPVPDGPIEHVITIAKLITLETTAIQAIAADKLPEQALSDVKARAKRIAIEHQAKSGERGFASKFLETVSWRSVILEGKVRWIGTAAASIIVLTSLSFLRAPSSDPDVAQVTQIIHSPADVLPSHRVGPDASPPVRTSIEIRWGKIFGDFPKVLSFPGQSNRGAETQFSDALAALTVNSERTVRLIQLGELKEDDALTLSIDVTQLTHQGTFGIFAGYELAEENSHEFLTFYRCRIDLQSHAEQTNAIAVEKVMVGPEGQSISDRDIAHIALKNPRGPQTLELSLTAEGFSSISIGGTPVGFRRRFFPDKSYIGPFGIVVSNGSFLFANPRLVRHEKGRPLP